MATDYVHVGDVGAVFTFTFTESDGTTAVDLTGATTVEVICQRKDKSEKRLTLTVTDAANGIATYTTTASGDLDIDGIWEAQGHTVIGTDDFTYAKVSFEVRPVFPAP